MASEQLTTTPSAASAQVSVRTVVEDCLRGLGYELVELDWRAGGNLRVFIEHAVGSLALRPDSEVRSEGPVPEDGSGIRIEDCERVSRQLSHLLTVENIDYARLEVSSPGLDRLLRGRGDFERFMGSEISLKLKFAVAGRRNYEGRLLHAQGEKFVIELLDRAAPADASRSGNKGRKPVAKKVATKAAVNEAVVAKMAPIADTAVVAPARQLTVGLDEIERARLVPNFKF